MCPRIALSWWLKKAARGRPHTGGHTLYALRKPGDWLANPLRQRASSLLYRFRVISATRVIRLNQNFKNTLTLLASHLASLLLSRVHRRGKPLHFIHEKEIYFAISLL